MCGRVVVYSLIGVFISMSPHCKRQSRSEEKPLTLIPLILRERENVKLFNRLHRRSICPNEIMKPNEKRRNKTKPYCIISKGRLNAESDFKSICAVYREREKEFIYSQKSWVVVV